MVLVCLKHSCISCNVTYIGPSVVLVIESKSLNLYTSGIWTVSLVANEVLDDLAKKKN